MANVLNRATRQYLRSVNEPDYLVQDWIINPNLDAVVGFRSAYWVITGDAVSLMTQSQRNAVDAAELSAQRDGLATQFNEAEDILRAFMLIVLDEFNAHTDKVNSLLDAMDASTSLADMKTRVGAITNYPTRTPAQLITAIRNRLGT